MLPRNRLELIERPSPADDATTLRFFAALDPASSFACTIAANLFIFSFGNVIVSSPDVLFLHTVHEPLMPKRFFLSPAGTTCNSSLQKSPGIHHRPQTMDRSPLLYLDDQSRKCASRSGTATAHSLRCHQFLSGKWCTKKFWKLRTGNTLRRPQFMYKFQPPARTLVKDPAVFGMWSILHCL